MFFLLYQIYQKGSETRAGKARLLKTCFAFALILSSTFFALHCTDTKFFVISRFPLDKLRVIC